MSLTQSILIMVVLNKRDEYGGDGKRRGRRGDGVGEGMHATSLKEKEHTPWPVMHDAHKGLMRYKVPQTDR